jgi:hypothetical protein
LWKKNIATKQLIALEQASKRFCEAVATRKKMAFDKLKPLEALERKR